MPIIIITDSSIKFYLESEWGLLSADLGKDLDQPSLAITILLLKCIFPPSSQDDRILSLFVSLRYPYPPPD